MRHIGVGHTGAVKQAPNARGDCADTQTALKGSDHLDFIVDNRLYRPVSPPEIEDMYEQVAPDAPDFTFVTQSQVRDGTAPPEQIILPAACHDLVAKVTGVPELSGEVERAVWQIERQFKREQSQQETQRQKQKQKERQPQLQQPPKHDAGRPNPEERKRA